jgi:hypothetical protein
MQWDRGIKRNLRSATPYVAVGVAAQHVVGNRCQLPVGVSRDVISAFLETRVIFSCTASGSLRHALLVGVHASLHCAGQGIAT